MSWGGQVGYGNESWGKVLIDFLGIDDNNVNVLALYEPGFRPLYWQFGLGLISDRYHGTLWEQEREWDYAEGFGIRIGLGYNYTLGKYLLIRPALELNLGLEEHSSSYAINLNFGFKTPNLW